MGKDYLIDTNVVSDFLRSAFPEQGMLFLANLIDLVPNISIITKIELLSFNAAQNEGSLIENFISNSHIFDL